MKMAENVHNGYRRNVRRNNRRNETCVLYGCGESCYIM